MWTEAEFESEVLEGLPDTYLDQLRRMTDEKTRIHERVRTDPGREGREQGSAERDVI
jgi:hypothetical protein